jgi:hypothetical protein
MPVAMLRFVLRLTAEDYVDKETRELVDAAERRAVYAAIGPWIVDETNCAVRVHNDIPAIGVVCRFGNTPQPRQDAEFIAHARADVPALCAKVREMAAAEDAALKEMGNIVANVAKELDMRYADPNGNEPVWIPVRRMRERIVVLDNRVLELSGMLERIHACDSTTDFRRLMPEIERLIGERPNSHQQPLPAKSL